MLDEMNELASAEISNLIEDLAEGNIELLDQVGESSLANKLNEDDMKIDWSRNAKTIKDLIRSGTENLNAWTMFNGKKLRLSLAVHQI